MIKERLKFLNIIILGIAAFLVLSAIFVTFIRPSSIPVLEQAEVKKGLPKSAFKLSKEAYNAIGEPVLSLKETLNSLQLPDLKKSLIYYGKNGRPDVDPNNPAMQLGFANNKTSSSLVPKERYYVLYDRKLTPPQYIFSPNNAETPLWIEVSPPQGNQVDVKVGMKDEDGKLITEPVANANFTMQEREFARAGTLVTWEIGKLRVDGTLLARQKAKWYGTDKFLEQHGGKEYQEDIGKQRIDFGEGNDTYLVFVKPNDVLIWDRNKWKVVEPGEATKGLPILVVKKIDDRLMNLELWDAEGKSKITLNLLKSNDSINPPNLMQNFKFIGARTRSQFLFEVSKERMILSPKDWLLLTDKGWKKLTTPDDIDAYVDRKMTGRLFVIDSVEKKDDRQIMAGTLYNSSRSDYQPIEILLQQGSTAAVKTKSDKDVNGSNAGMRARGRVSQVQAQHDEDDDEDDDESGHVANPADNSSGTQQAAEGAGGNELGRPQSAPSNDQQPTDNAPGNTPMGSHGFRFRR